MLDIKVFIWREGKREREREGDIKKKREREGERRMREREIECRSNSGSQLGIRRVKSLERPQNRRTNTHTQAKVGVRACGSGCVRVLELNFLSFRTNSHVDATLPCVCVCVCEWVYKIYAPRQNTRY